MKLENERASVACSRCRQNLVISRRRYAENLKNMCYDPCCKCITIIHDLLTNDIIVLWRCYCRRRRFLSSSQKKISRRGLAELKLHQKACRTCSIVIFPPSTNKKSLICGVDVAVAVVISLGSFSIDDGDGNDNTTNKQFDWSSEGNKRVARVARNYEQVCAILCKTTT